MSFPLGAGTESTDKSGAGKGQPRPAGFWPGALSALTRHLLLSVPWATLLAGCATGTVLLAVLGVTSRTPLDEGTVRLTFLPAVAAMAFVPRNPSPALAGTAPLPVGSPPPSKRWRPSPCWSLPAGPSS